FTLISGEPKAFHYIAQSGKGLDRNFCPNCGARVFTTNLESFPLTIFVAIGSLDNPKSIKPVVEMFTKRRLEWQKPLDLPKFETMPSWAGQRDCFGDQRRRSPCQTSSKGALP